jgi:two-component system cell cycle response regulator
MKHNGSTSPAKMPTNSVLVADDDPLFRKLVESSLRKWNYQVALAENGEDAWAMLQDADAPKLLVLDWMMPGLDGIELCRRIRGRDVTPRPYIILLTANDQKTQIAHGLNSGADDYLTKPFDGNELQARVHVGARTLALQDALHRKEQELRFAATHDSLTGLWNRRALMEFLHHDLARTRRAGFPMSIMMIDVDHFKKVNDNFGHSTGDAVLREIAQRLQGCCRDDDWVGRYGGEEFLVLAESCGTEGLPAFGERLRKSIADRPVITTAGEIPCTVSIGGVVVKPEDQGTCDSLVQIADAALYRAKNAGRNRVELAGLDDNQPVQRHPASLAALTAI